LNPKCLSNVQSVLFLPIQKQQVDNNVDALTARLERLETGASFDATQAAVRQVQMEMLENLRAIRSAMVDNSNGKGSSNSTSGGGVSSKELEALQLENTALKKQTAKQAYRIEHLVRSVEELLEKNKA
jgi:mannitol-specific phosphotransferase system IIBC component